MASVGQPAKIKTRTEFHSPSFDLTESQLAQSTVRVLVILRGWSGSRSRISYSLVENFMYSPSFSVMTFLVSGIMEGRSEEQQIKPSPIPR